MNLVERLRAVAAEKLTKMDRAACYETEAADRIVELESKLDASTKAVLAQQAIIEEQQSRLQGALKEAEDAKGLLKAFVIAMRCGATTEEILAEVRDGVGIVEPVVEIPSPIGGETLKPACAICGAAEGDFHNKPCKTGRIYRGNERGIPW